MRDTALKAHLKILDSVASGDAQAAQNAMIQHINTTQELHKKKYYLL